MILMAVFLVIIHALSAHFGVAPTAANVNPHIPLTSIVSVWFVSILVTYALPMIRPCVRLVMSLTPDSLMEMELVSSVMIPIVGPVLKMTHPSVMNVQLVCM